MNLCEGIQHMKPNPLAASPLIFGTVFASKSAIMTVLVAHHAKLLISYAFGDRIFQRR